MDRPYDDKQEPLKPTLCNPKLYGRTKSGDSSDSDEGESSTESKKMKRRPFNVS
jgi:hypothetical protein